eukprot:s723_g7.t1
MERIGKGNAEKAPCGWGRGASPEKKRLSVEEQTRMMIRKRSLFHDSDGACNSTAAVGRLWDEGRRVPLMEPHDVETMKRRNQRSSELLRKREEFEASKRGKESAGQGSYWQRQKTSVS